MSRRATGLGSARHGQRPSAGTRREHGDIEFLFEGRRLTARPGDTVAAVLIAHGVHVFGRSSKYHRPRGFRCGQGHCSACAMRIDGLPGVRSGVTPVRPGMRIEREHAWPSADVDLLRAAETLSPMLPAGFYYRWFRHSPRLWSLLERGLAQVAGQGALPEPDAARRAERARLERRAGPDVLVVGGGVAGMSAALAAAQAGAGVLRLERDAGLGGRPGDATDAGHGGSHEVAESAGLVRTHPDIETLLGAEAIGWYDDGIVAVDRAPDLLALRPAAVVLATGGYDRALPFPGWDLPGVMLAEGALRLLLRHAVVPGRRAVVITTDDFGHRAARRLAAGGVQVACIADLRIPGAIPTHLVDAAMAAGIPVLPHATAALAHGRRHIAALSLLAAGAGRPQRLACDLVCVSAGTRPADDLARQATVRGPLVLSPSTVPPSGQRLWLAGLANGARGADEAREQGRTAGAQAAAHAATDVS